MDVHDIGIQLIRPVLNNCIATTKKVSTNIIRVTFQINLLSCTFAARSYIKVPTGFAVSACLAASNHSRPIREFS
jgi:hypothetical protein